MQSFEDVSSFGELGWRLCTYLLRTTMTRSSCVELFLPEVFLHPRLQSNGSEVVSGMQAPDKPSATRTLQPGVTSSEPSHWHKARQYILLARLLKGTCQLG